MSDLTGALRLAEHFRQENERLRQQLEHSLVRHPEPRHPLVIRFAGWKVARANENIIETTSPGGHLGRWDDEHPLFSLLACIADFQP